MKNNRKGIISLMDAMIFLTLLSIVSVAMFSFLSPETQDEPMAKTICEDFLSIRLKASDVFETEDSDVYSISEIIAADLIAGGSEKVYNFVKDSMDDLVPATYGYKMSFEFEGKTMILSKMGCGGNESAYEKEISIRGAESLFIAINLF